MTLVRSKRRGGSPPQVRPYRESFLVQVHRLVDAAYARMKPSELKRKRETAITGLLADAMREVIEGPDRLRWACMYAIHDDPPIPTEGREGRERLRIDIELERTEPGAHPRFHFEAKRLYRGDSVAQYVNEGGLGAYVAGHYAASHETAGMLGYVQRGHVPAWVTSITEKLEQDPPSYGLTEDAPVWSQVTFNGCRLKSYESYHRRVSNGPLHIIHTFLLCC